jgi:hypothetical protein
MSSSKMSFADVSPNNEDALQAAVAGKPVSVAIEADESKMSFARIQKALPRDLFQVYFQHSAISTEQAKKHFSKCLNAIKKVYGRCHCLPESLRLI